jgi:hypothetical protein
MDVIVFPVTLDQFGPEVFADLGEDARHVVDSERRQHVAAVFRDKDQVDV